MLLGKKGLLFVNHHIIRHSSQCSLINEARERLQHLGEGKIHILKDEDSGIATITIDNPGKRNAISGSMMTQLESAVNELEKWSSGKGIILRAAGDVFCSGGDVSKRDGGLTTPHDGVLMSTFMHRTLTRMYCLPLISVALVNGKAIGGGAELTTLTDFRLFSDKAEVCFVQGRMGVVTGWGGATRLVQILGPKVALDLLATSRKLKFEEAQRIGFADHLLTGEDHYLETKNWLCERIIHHPAVTRAFKEIIIKARDSSMEASLVNERKLFSPLWGGPLNLEALSKNIKHK